MNVVSASVRQTERNDVYTNKDRVAVVMIVNGWRVEGQMHVLSGSRLTDALNSKAKDFLAVTDAKVFDAVTSNLLMEPAYLAVNRNSISVVYGIE